MESVLVKLSDSATSFWDPEYDQKVISNKNFTKVLLTARVQNALYGKHLVEASVEQRKAWEKENKTKIQDTEGVAPETVNSPVA